jgi:hypothetical protein
MRTFAHIPALVASLALVLGGLCLVPQLASAQSAPVARGPIPDGFGRLLVIADHDETEVEINGVSYPYEWIYGNLDGVFLPAGRRLEVIVTSGEDNRRTFRLRLEEGETRVLVVDIDGSSGGAVVQRVAPRRPEVEEEEEEEEEETQGYLGVSSSPRGVVFVDGAETDQRTPARRIALEPGRHEVQVYYDEEDTMSEVKHVLIRAGVNTNVFFRLRREQLDEPGE